jgi:DNA-3-methyladenine glycosylase I
MSAAEPVIRCGWSENDPLLTAYHDEEWGVPLRDSRALWEMLVLEGFQAGLSWITVLRKRDAFREAFQNFEPGTVARFGQRDINRLLKNEGIIRSRAKIEATIAGARAYLLIENGGQTFSSFVWSLIDNRPVRNKWQVMADVPAKTELSERISKELGRRGFKFVGPVIVYAWMQAVGLVNDHLAGCFRYKLS